jgi:threonine dehydrogenase-like Zn-dependent dehydrogenase
MVTMKPGTILGHEGVGVIEQLGPDVRNFKVGDRVVIPSTIACGYCVYCRAGYFAQCDNANPHGLHAGTAFFGGPEITGPFHGLQAEKARIPYANANLVKLPDAVSDDQAILLSDIFPTGYFGVELAEITPGDTVAVFGCGPVGQFAILSAKFLGAGRILAVATVPSRLEMARAQGAEVIDFNAAHPVETIRRLTGGIGVDAERPQRGPAAAQARQQQPEFEEEVEEIAPEADLEQEHWRPGDAPSLVLSWAVEASAKAGTLSIIGVYPPKVRFFPIATAMNKNLTVKMGNCNHRKYIPMLVDMVRSGEVDPAEILTQHEPLSSAIDAYKAFDERRPGWIKVKLQPSA